MLLLNEQILTIIFTDFISEINCGADQENELKKFGGNGRIIWAECGCENIKIFDVILLGNYTLNRLNSYFITPPPLIHSLTFH